jgi:hypothetical protein
MCEATCMKRMKANPRNTPEEQPRDTHSLPPLLTSMVSIDVQRRILKRKMRHYPHCHIRLYVYPRGPILRRTQNRSTPNDPDARMAE